MVRFLKNVRWASLSMLILTVSDVRATAASEYNVKAVFLYNFAKFIEWPSEAFVNSGDSFYIGVLGEDPFEKAIEQQLSGLNVQDKRLVFKRISDLQEATRCHVVFISASERKRLGAILQELRGSPVLTVSDVKNFVRHGGMVGFVLESNKVGFSINRTVAETAGLKISSHLLKLARTIAKSIHGLVTG